MTFQNPYAIKIKRGEGLGELVNLTNKVVNTLADNKDIIKTVADKIIKDSKKTEECQSTPIKEKNINRNIINDIVADHKCGSGFYNI